MNSDELLSETVRAVSEALEKSDITKHLDSLFEMRRNDMLNPKFLPLERLHGKMQVVVGFFHTCLHDGDSNLCPVTTV